MTFQTTNTGAEPTAVAAQHVGRLFAGGQRLGWTYRDPESLRVHFSEPEPQRQPVPVAYENRAHSARLAHEARKAAVPKAGGAIVLVLLLLTAVAGVTFAVLALVAAAVCLALVLHAGRSATTAATHLEAKRAELEHHFQYAWNDWYQRGARHTAAQDGWVSGQPAWGALPTRPGTRRLDVFGGSQRSREGFLTVFGTSTLQQQPLIVVDLTQAHICQELAELAGLAGVPVDVQLLPSRIADSGIVSGLTADGLVDALVEAMYADDSTAHRAARSLDTRILHQLCGVLGGDVTPARLGAGLRALAGEFDDTDALTRAERNRIADDLLGAKNKDQLRDSLLRLVSFIQPLERLGVERGDRGPGYLTCIALDFATGSASTEMLADLAVQSVTRRLAGFAEAVPAVVVALGEQGIQRRCMEQLASVCERRGAQLTVLHPHLRDGAQEVIGGGTVGFMRLGNHQEAGIAADFMGRHHSFVMHSLTDTEGTTVSTSVAKTVGSSLSTGTTLSESVTRGSNWGNSSTYQPGSVLFPSSTSTNSGGSYSETSGTSTSTTHTTNESTSYTTSDGTNTSVARGRQRVYEYAVEPTQLQALADFSLLLVERGPDGSVRVHPADCNPNIVLLDGVSTEPLPHAAPPAAVTAPGWAGRA
ncbi:hypothetical protein ACIPPS_23465 [Streptomyces sp. NPDC090127]|uniref:hypothetical protein n=1 Tax=Streptomyces sp. NPDC090127 TaxID=3365953 RepID=UPI0038163768